MNYTNGLAKEEFLQHIFEAFPSVFDNTFSRTMLENIVNCGTADNFTHTKNELYYFLTDMIPEITPEDLLPYMDEAMLTNEVLSNVPHPQGPTFDPKSANPQQLTESQHREFIAYWFDQYERTGFSAVFDSPYTFQAQYKGQRFEVLGRCGEDTHDLEVLPAWNIRLECGDEIEAYPEEICELEHQRRMNKPALAAQIQSATSRAPRQPASEKAPDPVRQ